MKQAVFLDRDGVLNRAIVRDGKPHPPSALSELRLLPGVKDGIARLRQAGFLLIVVSNQPDVARGKQQKEVIEEINKALLLKLDLNEICTCYHDDEDRCSCRKPLPGMLLEAADRLSITLSRSFLIGDRWRDVEAGRNAGCKTVLINRHYKEKRAIAPDFTASSFSEAVKWILTAHEKQMEGIYMAGAHPWISRIISRIRRDSLENAE